VISLEDLDYTLPPERVAQAPTHPRDAARLLVVERASGRLEEARFADLPERIGPNDLVVANDTRVIPARLRGRRATGGRAEALLVERRPDGRWIALVRGRARPGTELLFGALVAKVEDVQDGGACRLRFAAGSDADLDALLARAGEAPLPPYIARDAPRDSDLDDYQTVFARAPGAVAAPTAGLHFTPELLARLRMAYVTLHVGPGTFRPIRGERLEGHRMDAERFEVPAATAEALAKTRAAGGRVVAIGTTVVRALESTGGAAGAGRTDLFITPGFRFRAVDELVTNFHLPRSTLLALVMAFAGVELVRRAYAHAVAAGFRFYSYGDAMWIR
jgi:S-adenosylmethionine:tRNA ribosyltransferase-isomerase